MRRVIYDHTPPILNRDAVQDMQPVTLKQWKDTKPLTAVWRTGTPNNTSYGRIMANNILTLSYTFLQGIIITGLVIIDTATPKGTLISTLKTVYMGFQNNQWFPITGVDNDTDEIMHFKGHVNTDGDFELYAVQQLSVTNPKRSYYFTVAIATQ